MNVKCYKIDFPALGFTTHWGTKVYCERTAYKMFTLAIYMLFFAVDITFEKETI